MSNKTDYLDEDCDIVPLNQKWVLYAYIEPKNSINKLKLFHDLTLFIDKTESNNKKRNLKKNKGGPSILNVYSNNIDYYNVSFIMDFFESFCNRNRDFLDKMFNIKYPDLATQVQYKIVKFFGAYKTKKKAMMAVKRIEKRNKKYNILLSNSGYWCRCDQNTSKKTNVLYNNEKMNSLMESHLNENVKSEESFKLRRQTIQQYNIIQKMKAIKKESEVQKQCKETNNCTLKELELEYNKYNNKLEYDLNIESNIESTVNTAIQSMIEGINSGDPTPTIEILKEFNLYDEYYEKVRNNIKTYLKQGRNIIKSQLIAYDFKTEQD